MSVRVDICWAACVWSLAATASGGTSAVRGSRLAAVAAGHGGAVEPGGHRVAGADVEKLEAEMDRGGSTAEGRGVTDADLLGEFTLEGIDVRSQRSDPVRRGQLHNQICHIQRFQHLPH